MDYFNSMFHTPHIGFNAAPPYCQEYKIFCENTKTPKFPEK